MTNKSAKRSALFPRPSGYQLIKHRGGHAQLIGYARVSTREQNLDAQLDALGKAGCCRVYAEKVSSVQFRPGWAAVLDVVDKGDTIVVASLDRIGRKLGEVVASVEALHGQGAYIRSLRQGIDTRSASGRQILPIWAALAETERELIRERTHAGLDAARARGKTFGRPTVLTRAKIDMVVHLRGQGHSLDKIAKAVGIGEGTVRKALELADKEDPRQLRLLK